MEPSASEGACHSQHDLKLTQQQIGFAPRAAPQLPPPVPLAGCVALGGAMSQQRWCISYRTWKKKIGMLVLLHINFTMLEYARGETDGTGDFLARLLFCRVRSLLIINNTTILPVSVRCLGWLR